MNNSKLKSAFGIDDILCSRSASKSPPPVSSKDKNTDYTAAMNSANLDYGHGQTNMASEMFLNGHQPKKPLALFPSTMDFAKNGFYMPGLTTPFSPSTYLEQYASALQKASPRLWPFYPHPYGGYLLPACNFKRKGGQVRFTPQQTTSLERRFSSHKYLSPEDRKHLALQLKLSDRQVKTWFQNRRAKWRRSNAAVTTTDNHQNHTYLQNMAPLNLHKQSHLERLEKHINVATTDIEDSSSDDDDVDLDNKT